MSDFVFFKRLFTTHSIPTCGSFRAGVAQSLSWVRTDGSNFQSPGRITADWHQWGVVRSSQHWFYSPFSWDRLQLSRGRRRLLSSREIHTLISSNVRYFWVVWELSLSCQGAPHQCGHLVNIVCQVYALENLFHGSLQHGRCRCYTKE